MSIFDVVINILEIMSYFWFVNQCLIKNKLYNTGYLILLFMICFVSLTYSNYFHIYSTVSTILMFVILLVYAIIYFENSLIEKITIGITPLVISLLATILSFSVFDILLGKSINMLFSKEQGYESFVIIARIFSFIMLCFVIKYRKKMITGSIDKKWFGLIIALILSVIAMFILFDLLVYNVTMQKSLMFVILAILIIFICIFISIFIIQKDEMQKICNLLMIQELEHQSNIMNKSQDNYNELHVLKHDLNHELDIVSGLLEKNDVQQALRLLSDYRDKVWNVTNFVHTGNNIIDYLIYIKLSLAKEKNIEVKSQIELFDVKIDQNDLCLILANIFDNAIENTKGDNFLEFEFRLTNDFIKIRLINSIVNKGLNNICNFTTCKSDKINHGYGIKSVRSLVNKHKGIIEIREKDDLFSVDILIHNSIQRN